MEVVSWSGAVDDNPITIVELAHLKIRSEGLWEDRGWLVDSLITAPISWQGKLVFRDPSQGQHSQDMHLSHHCSSAGTSQAELRSALDPKSTIQVLGDVRAMEGDSDTRQCWPGTDSRTQGAGSLDGFSGFIDKNQKM